MAPPTAVGHIILAGHHWSQSSIQTFGLCSALFSHLLPPYGRGGKVKMCSAAWCLFSLGIFFFPFLFVLGTDCSCVSRGCTLALDSLQVSPPSLRRPGTWPVTGTGSKVQNICTTLFFFFFYRLFWTLKQSVRFKWSLPPAIPIFSGVGKVSFFAWAQNVCCNLNCYCVLPRNLFT